MSTQPLPPPARPPEIPEEGFFGPGTVMWKINREHAVLLGGPAAAVLQVAHPAVALGVARHSNFQYDTLGRLWRTLNSVYEIGFGRRDTIEAAAARVRRAHAPVHGDAPPLKADPERTRYNAFDADLQYWVLATLVQGALFHYERFVGPVTIEEKETFLNDMRLWATFFGLPLSHGPSTWESFDRYYQEMLHGDLLGSDPVCGEMARAVAHPRHPFWLRGASWPMQFLVTETIPEPLLHRLGMHSRGWTRGAWRLTERYLPKIYPFLPDTLRFPSQYRARVA